MDALSRLRARLAAPPDIDKGVLGNLMRDAERALADEDREENYLTPHGENQLFRVFLALCQSRLAIRETAASWCPRCGNCQCPRRANGELIEADAEGDGPEADEARNECPLHGDQSLHQEPPEEPRPAPPLEAIATLKEFFAWLDCPSGCDDEMVERGREALAAIESWAAAR